MNKDKHIYKVIIDELKRISQKDVIFGFIEDYSFGTNLILDGKFIMMANDLNTETISVNHKKEFTRTIKINYIKPNNLKDNSINEIINIEQIFTDLCQSKEILNRTINIDYNLYISILKKEETDLTGVLNIEINLNIKER